MAFFRGEQKEAIEMMYGPEAGVQSPHLRNNYSTQAPHSFRKLSVSNQHSGSNKRGYHADEQS